MRLLATSFLAASIVVPACASTPPNGNSTTPTMVEAVSSTTGAIPTEASGQSFPPFDAFGNEPPGATGCQPTSPMIGNEVLGTGLNVQIHGLVFVKNTPIRVGDEVKIVWRMTGSGNLTATAISPTGGSGPLAWGPEPHSGSTFDRPGDEWGVGYVFTEPGCWQLHLQRADSAGDVWLSISS